MICPYCSKSFDHRSVDTPGPGCGCGKAAHDADMDGTVDGGGVGEGDRCRVHAYRFGAHGVIG